MTVRSRMEGTNPAPEPLDGVGLGGLAREGLGSFRLDGDDTDARARSLQGSPHPGHRPARPDARDEGVEAALRRGQDLGARARLVHLRVRRVVELAGHEAAGVVCEDPVRLLDGALHELLARRQHEDRPVVLEQAPALEAHVVRHGEHEPVTLHGGHEGEADAGVAARGLDDRVSGLQRALLLGRFDHGEGDAILRAPGGVEALELDHDLRRALRDHATETHHGRRPDEVEHRVRDGHLSWPGASGSGPGAGRPRPPG